MPITSLRADRLDVFVEQSATSTMLEVNGEDLA
jgi:hypothetical protein